MKNQVLSRIAFAIILVTVSAPAQAAKINIGAKEAFAIGYETAKEYAVNGSAATKTFVIKTAPQAIKNNPVSSAIATAVTAAMIGTAVYLYKQSKKADKEQSKVARFCKKNGKKVTITGSVLIAAALAGYGINKYINAANSTFPM